jgi:hypothetical protein
MVEPSKNKKLTTGVRGKSVVKPVSKPVVARKPVVCK